jgi:hypothetical protein
MSDTIKIPVDLRTDGLLWLINRTVFHPRGFALAYDLPAGTFELWGNGDEPWQYQLEGEENDLFLAAEAAFARVREVPSGPSPRSETVLTREE